MKTKRRNIHRINKTKTLYKSISKNKTKRKSKNKTKRKQLGGDNERVEYYKKLRDYRERFIKVFLPIISFKNKNEKNFDKKDKFFIETFIGIIKKFFEYKEDKIDEIAGCVMTKFTLNLKPADINTLAEYEIKAIMKQYVTECNQ